MLTGVLRDLDLHSRAKNGVVLVETTEETRFLNALVSMTTEGGFTRQRNRPIICWSSTMSVHSVTRNEEQLLVYADASAQSAGQGAAQQAPTVIQFLQSIPDRKDGVSPTHPNGSAIYVVRDIHPYLFNSPGNPAFAQRPVLLRALRDLVERLRMQNKTVILISAQAGVELPPDLVHEIPHIDIPLPTPEELRSVVVSSIDRVREAYPSIRVDESEETVGAIVRALQGLSEPEVLTIMRMSLSRHRTVDIRFVDDIIAHKREVVSRSGVLTIEDAHVNMDDVGGMDRLMTYIQQRSLAWSPEAREFGVDRPRGMLLIGPPGAGKSLVSRMLASAWRMPLIKFDVGQLMNHLLGESEARMRQALKIVEASAPCVLWMDELEKMFGSGGGELDGGTRASMFGTLLTWMNDCKAPVYIAATSNDVQKLRAELLRAGRFDARFFVDLPNAQEREAILAIHLRRRNRNPEDFDLVSLAAATDEYTGAELEQVVKDAITAAFFTHQGQAQLSDADLHTAVAGVTPIARTMRESIRGLRAWATERAQFASTPILEMGRRASAGAGLVDLGE